MIKIKRFPIVVLFLTFFITIATYSNIKTGKMKIEISGFKNNNGNARILIFESKNSKNFPSGIDKALKGYVLPIKNNKVEFVTENLPFGDYAISAHHDENGNNKIDKNFFGIPNEGLGASNNPKVRFGPPNFEECKVMLYIENISLKINLVN